MGLKAIKMIPSICLCSPIPYWAFCFRILTFPPFLLLSVRVADERNSLATHPLHIQRTAVWLIPALWNNWYHVTCSQISFPPFTLQSGKTLNEFRPCQIPCQPRNITLVSSTSFHRTALIGFSGCSPRLFIQITRVLALWDQPRYTFPLYSQYHIWSLQDRTNGHPGRIWYISLSAWHSRLSIAIPLI